MNMTDLSTSEMPSSPVPPADSGSRGYLLRIVLVPETKGRTLEEIEAFWKPELRKDIRRIEERGENG
jgi:hypothetical protein